MSGDVDQANGWGASARDWAATQEGTLQPLFAAVLRQTEVGQGTTVLDVGCGTGLFCLLAAERGATVAGLDAAPGQLAVARERLPLGDFRQGDIGALPFADGAFDLVSSCNALQYASDPVEALREMKRVARPGATVAILGRSRNGPHASEAYSSALSALGSAAPGARSSSVFRQPSALEAAITEAGLTVAQETEVQCDWVYPDLATALRGTLSFAPGVRAIRASGEAAVHEAVAKALEPYRTTDGGYHLPNLMRFVLTTGQ